MSDNKTQADIPQPDPNWKTICEQCNEGEIEPRMCRYYGEPCGCNSPIYGQHPMAGQSSAVGNASSLRMALLLIRAEFDDMSGMRVGAKYCFSPGRLVEQIDAALAAPPRNCDRFTDEVDAQLAFLNEVWLISVTRETMLERDKFDNWTCEMRAEYAKWLFASAKGGQECES